jgi:hypothetical protein
MTAQIVIDDGEGTTIGSVDREAPFLGTTFGVSNFDNTGVLGHRWTLLDKPPGSSAALSALHNPTAEFTADVPGSYLVRLETFKDEAREHLDDADEQLVGIRFAPPLAWLMPAAGQTRQLDEARGWAEQVEEILRDTREYLLPNKGDFLAHEDFLLGPTATGWGTTTASGGQVLSTPGGSSPANEAGGGVGLVPVLVTDTEGSRAALHWPGSILNGGHNPICKARVRTHTTLANAVLRIGLGASTTWGDTYARATPTGAGWVLEVASAASGLDASDTGGAAAPSTWYEVEILVVDGVATLFIDGQQVAEVDTAAVPADGEGLRPMVSMDEDGGSGNAIVDYIQVRGARR